MGDFTPSVPLQLQIRKIIFEKYNNPDNPFNNDDIFEIIKKNGDLDPSFTIDDMEPFFHDLCDSGLTRNIAQNFTTIWLKLFDSMTKTQCKSCNQEIFVGSEEKLCPNPDCKASI